MHKKYIIGILSVLFSLQILADIPLQQKTEIEHLLQYVRNTECSIHRNDTQHNGTDALVHIQKKYDYFKNKITSAESFIKYAATKSTMTNKYYTVICPGRKAVKVKDWLLKELKSYRAFHIKMK